MRYSDEGETNELCKWTVDLSSLPTFQQNAASPQMGGFYTGVYEFLLARGFYRSTNLCTLTDFELGLELDSAEVRGILLFNNQEWGRSALGVSLIFPPWRKLTYDSCSVKGYIRFLDVNSHGLINYAISPCWQLPISQDVFSLYFTCFGLIKGYGNMPYVLPVPLSCKTGFKFRTFIPTDMLGLDGSDDPKARSQTR